MRYDCVLFDMDGTLLDTLDDLTDSCNAAMDKFGYPNHTRDSVRGFINNGAKRLIERAVPDWANPEDIKECLLFFKAHYRNNFANKTQPYPGVIKLVQELRARGVLMGVVSNKFDSAVKLLSDKFFSGYISAAVGERESEGIRRKPHPDTAFEAMRLLKADASKTLYTGDSDVDIETAKNAGLDCLSVSWGFRSRQSLIESGARFIADTPGEFIDVMEKM